VTLVEFTDLQCPFRGRCFSNTFPQVIKQYVDTGKVRYVLREMPLTKIHPDTEKAAEAVLSAGVGSHRYSLGPDAGRETGEILMCTARLMRYPFESTQGGRRLGHVRLTGLV